MSKTTTIGKSFVQNHIKNRKYFSAHQYQNLTKFDIKHLRWSKTDLSKETKKILRRDTLRISVAVIPMFNVKKVFFIFKILPPVYLHIIKIDIKYWRITCINLSKS